MNTDHFSIIKYLEVQHLSYQQILTSIERIKNCAQVLLGHRNKTGFFINYTDTNTFQQPQLSRTIRVSDDSKASIQDKAVILKPMRNTPRLDTMDPKHIIDSTTNIVNSQ